MSGILIQWYFEPNNGILLLISSGCFLFLFLFFILPFFSRYRFAYLNGIAAALLFISLGSLHTRQQDIRNHGQWFGRYLKELPSFVIILDEPLVEKANSFKARARVSYRLRGPQRLPVRGSILVYFKKDSIPPGLSYGSQLIVRKPLQEIRNSGNPGGFDYKRYSLFQGITHQVFLQRRDFELLAEKKEGRVDKLLYAIRRWVLAALRASIKSEKELGLAEALLIGYRDDLDRSLVQSYTNTGVVHIIAISGLHLGLIYALLVYLLKPLGRKKQLAWLRPLLVIAGLWLFSLLAGGQPSILRSAVMFTCIVAGESLGRKGNIYNTLAVSAFILLCINPFWLWDIGFQLSYAAVLSIVLFMRPVYRLFYIRNKWLDHVWQLNAVTIAAQVLTVPLCIYHFHQFPNYFLLTNFVAVPLSSAALIGELLVCGLFFSSFLACLAGKMVCWIIWFMNSYIEWVEALPFSLWDGLLISIPQAMLLFLCLAGLSYWLMEKSRKGFKLALLSLLFFVALRAWSFTECRLQRRIIIYNIPQKTAIDLISGTHYVPLGDTSLLQDEFAQRFHLHPCRVIHRAAPAASFRGLYAGDNYISFYSTRILLPRGPVSLPTPPSRPGIDLVILSGKSSVSIPSLAHSYTIRKLVFDSSVSPWKAKRWKSDCDSLAIPYHDVLANGAFVMNLQ